MGEVCVSQAVQMHVRKGNAVACHLRHVRVHLYQVKPALADTERTRHEGRTQEQHTRRTQHTDTTQAGGGAHERGKEDTTQIPRVTSRGSARITWDFQMTPLWQ